MATVYRKTFTKPLPTGAELFTRKGVQLARWKPAKGKARTAAVTTGKDGSPRVIVEAGTFTAKYRDGGGVVREVATGCRDETAARAVLAQLTRRAELVNAGIVTTAEDAVADQQQTPLASHIEAYGEHLRAANATDGHRKTTLAYLRRLARDGGWARLGDLQRPTLERWLIAEADAGRSARSRNAHRTAAVAFCRWCVQANRLARDPFGGVPKANEKTDPRRKRRALTEDELRRLLRIARLRPLAEFGRDSVQLPPDECRGRRTWTKAPLTLDTLDAAAERGRAALVKRPDFISELDHRGRERTLISKSLLLTGLRKGELDSLTAGQLELDSKPAYAVLEAADEKNREGSAVPLRADLADDLRTWLADKLTTLQAESRAASEPIPARLPADTPVFNVPVGLVRILDRDLRAAGIPKRDDRGRTVDVHAMRTTFGTHLSMGGVPLRTAQAAMRHSDPALTANVYTDPRLLDVAGALDVLPALPLDGADGAERQRATGTDAGALAPLLAPNPDESGASGATAGKTDRGELVGRRFGAGGATACVDKRKDSLTIAVNESDKSGRLALV